MRIAVLAMLCALCATARAGGHKPHLRPWLGVSIDDQDASWGGVAVYDVFDDTPASLCGLRGGDEILAIDRVDVHGTGELQAIVSVHEVGDRVTLSYVRRNEVRRCATRLQPQVTDPTELLHRRLVDKAMPPFHFSTHADHVDLTDTGVRGDVVVLGLFSTSCDDCAAVLGDLADRLAADDGARAARFFAVAGEGDAALDAYVQRLGLGAPLAADTADFVRHYLADRDDATILVIDARGLVRFAASGRGPDDTQLDGAVYCASRAERARQKDE
jgi:hypothetical protein